MLKQEFISKKRVLDFTQCTNENVMEYITDMQKARAESELGKPLTWDYTNHQPGWQILTAEQINPNVPVLILEGEMIYKDPEDFKTPVAARGDMFKVKDGNDQEKLMLVLDFAFKSEKQNVQFFMMGLAVNPRVVENGEEKGTDPEPREEVQS